MPDQKTTKQVRKAPNPTGKGGFAEHPENRSDGRWSKDNSFSYWFNFFKNLSVKEFEEWKENNPEDERSMASSMAYTRITNARSDLKEFQEIADRTEGKPKQGLEHTGKDGGPIETASITYMPKQLPDKYWEKNATTPDPTINNS